MYRSDKTTNVVFNIRMSFALIKYYFKQIERYVVNFIFSCISVVYHKLVYRSCEVKLKLYNVARFHVHNEIFSCNLRRR